VVTEVRRFRSDQGLKPAQRVHARFAWPTGAGAGLAAHDGLIRSLVRLDEPEEGLPADRHADTCPASRDRGAGTPGAPSTWPPSGPGWARTGPPLRRRRRPPEAKLGNAEFLAKAPEPVVAKIKERLAAAEAEAAPDRRGAGGARMIRASAAPVAAPAGGFCCAGSAAPRCRAGRRGRAPEVEA